MNPRLTRLALVLRRGFKKAANSIIGFIAVVLLRLIRRGDRVRFANTAGRVMRRVGPFLSKHKVGRANLVAAFPEKSPAEIEAILAGVWDNLGRVAAEFAHLDHIWEHDPARPGDSRIEIEKRSYELFTQLRLDGKPALIFAGHLANWELPALAAVAHGLNAAILYRRPNIASADRIIQDMRAVKMGTLIPASRDAPLKLRSEEH